jgi:hypothetical protein
MELLHMLRKAQWAGGDTQGLTAANDLSVGQIDLDDNPLLRTPLADGRHFLLDTATLNIMSDYQGTPAVQRWNAPLAP